MFFFFKHEFPPYVWRPRNENLRWWSNLSSTLIQNGWYTKNEKKEAFAAQKIGLEITNIAKKSFDKRIILR